MKSLKIFSILLVATSFLIAPLSFAQPWKLTGTKIFVIGHEGKVSVQSTSQAMQRVR